MMAVALRSRIIPSSTIISNSRSLKRWSLVEQNENVSLEAAQRRLSILERVPQFPPSLRPPKVQKELIKSRGPETVNNQLLYDQYGIMTLCGGRLKHGHIEMIRNTINKKIELSRMFAAWRIDPPHKPMTKKGLGKRMGKGKGNIDHYTVPIKAGRILIEVGGAIEFTEVEPLLQEICYKLPVDAIPVSKKILNQIEAYFEYRDKRNTNPFSMRQVFDNNMHGCSTWIRKLDKVHYGDYI